MGSYRYIGGYFGFNGHSALCLRWFHDATPIGTFEGEIWSLSSNHPKNIIQYILYTLYTLYSYIDMTNVCNLICTYICTG